jgi:CRISPR-associated protein Csx3
MVNLLPAVLVGGPPHAGKSVLFYHLTQALRACGVSHHAIRACPDGEGNWFHEGDTEMVSTIRVKLTGEWPATFVQRICQDLEHRCLPFLVDMGGHPRASQESLFRFCTHSILLLRADKPQDTQRWQHLIEENNLLPLARLFSRQEGDAAITARTPVLEGTLTGLERHVIGAGAGPVFDELVKRIAALFTSYDLQDQKKVYLEHAPTEFALDLQRELQVFTTESTNWQTIMLPRLLARLPTQVPLSVYGIGPNWLYAALAAYEDQQPLYLFDPKLPFGWVQPARVYLGAEHSSEIHVKTESSQEITVLKITFPFDRLAYFQPDALAFPPVSTEKGLIIDGRVPFWLLTALTRLYKACGVPWIAPFYVPLNSAIVAYSRVEKYQPGDLAPNPMF